MATLTVYCVAGANTGLDSNCYRYSDPSTWADIHDNADGTGTTVSNASFYAALVQSSTTSNRWAEIDRGFYLFDTSALPDNANISSATLSLYGSSKADTGSWSPSINIYSANPAATNNIVNADYDQVGTTPYSTAITYANWSTTGYNDFALNATGIAAISKDGITKFSSREVTYDVANTAPTWASNKVASFTIYTADNGDAYRPKLVINYTTGQIIDTSDAMTIGEANTNIRTLLSTISDALSITDAITALKGITSTVVDAINLSDFITTARTFVTTIIDSITMSETINVKRLWDRDTKTTSTYTNDTKTTSSYTNDSKTSSSWTNDSK